jgi:hypothetical protein
MPGSTMIALVAALLAVYGAYAAWAALASHTLVWLPLAFLALLGAVGLFFNQPWSRYLVYVVSLLAVSAWVIGFAGNVNRGLWPYPDPLSSAISLVPGLLLITLRLASSLLVGRHFKK